MTWCWVKGAIGDAINAVLSATGYILRWLLRAVACGLIKPFYFVQILWQLIRGIRHGLGSALRKNTTTFGTVLGVWGIRLGLCAWML